MRIVKSESRRNRSKSFSNSVEGESEGVIKVFYDDDAIMLLRICSSLPVQSHLFSPSF